MQASGEYLEDLGGLEQAADCGVSEPFPVKHAGEALEGKAAVWVSAVWLRNPPSDCVSPCFLDQGHFITKVCGAGDRLHQPTCLLSFG